MLNEVSQMGHDGECLGRKIVVGLLLETLAVWDGVCCLFGLTCHCGIGHSALQHTVIVFCGHAESLAGLGGDVGVVGGSNVRFYVMRQVVEGGG